MNDEILIILRTYIFLIGQDPMIATILVKTYTFLNRLDPMIAIILGYQYSKIIKTYMV